MAAKRLEQNAMDNHRDRCLKDVPVTSLFDNLPDIISVKSVAALLEMSVGTLYQWKARPEKYGTPLDLFHRFGRKLYIRRDVLKTWIATRSN